ncbi:MAG: helix-turn-helix domain-containing protein [Planctomycetota bacterium]
MARKKKTTTNAVEILHKRYIRGNKKRLESLEKERGNLNIAEQIHTLRTQAGLSQKQLAELVGTTQSVISRLEDADYTGHSLAVLDRIGAALQQRVEVRFVPERKRSMSRKDKKRVSVAVKKVAREYGEVLKKLSRE